VVSLPFRGPRPTLKGEEPLELRLMDDIVIPRSLAYGSHPDRPPYAWSTRPSSYSVAPRSNAIQLVAVKTASSTNEAAANAPSGTIVNAGFVQVSAPQPGDRQPVERLTVVAVKSGETYEVAKYERDGDLLMFVDTQGRKGGVNVNEVDWRKTSEMTGAARSGNIPLPARQLN
jgi:hypothetical protein